jgi:hypothetical protein
MSDMVSSKTVFEMAQALAFAQKLSHEALIRAGLLDRHVLRSMIDFQIEAFVANDRMDAANLLRMMRDEFPTPGQTGFVSGSA